MEQNDFNTGNMRHWLERWRTGDLSGRDEILMVTQQRLEALVRRMLRGDRVRRWEETGDVLVAAQMKLLKALEQLPPPTSTREFFDLAALQIRRILCSLARHYYGGQGLGQHHASNPQQSGGGDLLAQKADSAADGPEELQAWSNFHALVETLPEMEKAVVNLCYYAGNNYSEAGEELGVSHTTVLKHWNRAMLKLRAVFGGEADVS